MYYVYPILQEKDEMNITRPRTASPRLPASILRGGADDDDYSSFTAQQRTEKPPQDRSPKRGYRHYPLRDVPVDLLEQLKTLAKRHGRSLNKEIIAILDDYMSTHEHKK